MRWLVFKLKWKLYFNGLLNKIDIILTHAPPFGLNDGENLAHRGFKVYRKLIKKLKPRYLFMDIPIYLIVIKINELSNIKKLKLLMPISIMFWK